MFEETAAYTRDDAKKDYKIWSRANVAYHNGTAIMSDAEFDRLTNKVAKFYPSVLTKSGAEPLAQHASARKVRLPIPMNSLDKAYDKDVPRSIKSRLISVTNAVISEKVDGASLQLNRKDQPATALFTRGKDGVGQDVSHLLPLLKEHGIIGDIRPGQVVRFELVLPKGAMPEMDDDDSTKRNAIAGIINARNPNVKLLAKAQAIALSFMYPVMAPSIAFAKLKAQGWRVPKHQLIAVEDIDATRLKALYQSWKSKAKYDIDGLVVAADKAEKPTLSNPKFSFAYKLNNKGPTAEVVKIQWQVSRYRQMKPVAIIKPVDIDGVKVTKVTAHNAKYVKDNKIGPGTLIEVVRSGGVIPYIVQVIQQSAKAAFPPAGTYEWDETKVNILSVDDAHDLTANARQLQNFFSKIGVLGFGPRVAELVADLTIPEIVKLTSGGWIARGAGPANADKLPKAITAAIVGTTIPKLMAYSGVFGQGFGESRAVDLWAVIKETKPTNKVELRAELASLAGWSDVTAKDVAYAWRDWTKWFNSLPCKPSTTKSKLKAGPLSGQQFVFTKIRDFKLADDITKAGGVVAERITKATTHLIYKDGEESVKTAKAKKDGVTLVPYSKARKLLKL